MTANKQRVPYLANLQVQHGSADIRGLLALSLKFAPFLPIMPLIVNIHPVAAGVNLGVAFCLIDTVTYWNRLYVIDLLR